MTLHAERPHSPPSRSTVCERLRTTSGSFSSSRCAAENAFNPSNVVGVNVKPGARPPGGESVSRRDNDETSYTDDARATSCKSNKRTKRDALLFVPFRPCQSSRPAKRHNFVNGEDSLCAPASTLHRTFSLETVGMRHRVLPSLPEHDVVEHLYHTEAKLDALEENDWSNEPAVLSIINALLSNLNETAAIASDETELTPQQRQLCQSISTTKLELKQLLTNLFTHDTQLIEQSLLLLS